MSKPVQVLHLWITAVSLGVLASLPYLQTVLHQFINYDDNLYVTENWAVMNGLSWRGISWAFASLQIANWHPLTWISHMIDVQIWGMWPGGHHLTSVLFHAANTILVFFVFRSMRGAIWRSAMVAAVFAVHPLHVESVAWIAERKDVLSTFFGLLAIGAYVLYTRSPSVGRYLTVCVLFVLSLMSKSMLVTLPCVFLLFDIWPLKRWRFWEIVDSGVMTERIAQHVPLKRLVLEKLPLFSMSVACAVITVVAQARTGTVSSLQGVPLVDRILNTFLAYQSYIANFVYPVNLTFFYPLESIQFDAEVMLAVAVLVTLTSAAVIQRRRRPWVLIGWLFYLGTLVPVIGIVHVGLQSMADRYMYVPLLGLAMATVWSIPARTERSYQLIVVGVCGVAIAAMLVATWRQVGYWRDNPTLYERGLAISQRNYVAYQNLGSYYEALGELDTAIRHYEQCLAINPRYASARESMGNALTRKGDFAGALEQLKYAPRNSTSTHNRLGVIMVATNQYQMAESAFRMAIELDEFNFDAHSNLGATLLHLQRWNEAIEHLQIVLDALPHRHGVRLNLAHALIGAGRRDDAIVQLNRILQVVPNHNDARQLIQALTNSSASPPEHR